MIQLQFKTFFFCSPLFRTFGYCSSKINGRLEILRIKFSAERTYRNIRNTCGAIRNWRTIREEYIICKVFQMGCTTVSQLQRWGQRGNARDRRARAVFPFCAINHFSKLLPATPPLIIVSNSPTTRISGSFFSRRLIFFSPNRQSNI